MSWEARPPSCSPRSNRALRKQFCLPVTSFNVGLSLRRRVSVSPPSLPRYVRKKKRPDVNSPREIHSRPGTKLWDILQIWIVRSRLDHFLKHEPIRFELRWNESLRSMELQAMQEASLQCSHRENYACFSELNAKTEMLSQVQRHDFQVLRLDGLEANRFLILRDKYHAELGFPNRSSVLHQVHSSHDVAVIFNAPYTSQLICMITGVLHKPTKKTLPHHTSANVTTISPRLLRREQRCRVRVNPASSLRMLVAMQRQQTSEVDLEKAIDNLLGATSSDADAEEERKLAQTVINVATSRTTSRKPLSKEFEETLRVKAVNDAKPLRPATARKEEAELDHFVKYADCVIQPQHIIIYRAGTEVLEDLYVEDVINAFQGDLQSIQSQREFASENKIGDLSPLEVTMRWHSLIRDIPSKCAKELPNHVLHSAPLGEEIRREGFNFPTFLKIFGTGVCSIDVLCSKKEEVNVDFRHSFIFSGRA